MMGVEGGFGSLLLLPRALRRQTSHLWHASQKETLSQEPMQSVSWGVLLGVIELGGRIGFYEFMPNNTKNRNNTSINISLIRLSESDFKLGGACFRKLVAFCAA